MEGQRSFLQVYQLYPHSRLASSNSEASSIKYHSFAYLLTLLTFFLSQTSPIVQVVVPQNSHIISVQFVLVKSKRDRKLKVDLEPLLNFLEFKKCGSSKNYKSFEVT